MVRDKLSQSPDSLDSEAGLSIIGAPIAECERQKPSPPFFETRIPIMSRLAITIVASIVTLGILATRVGLAEEAKCEGTITKIEGEKITVKSPTGEQHMDVVPATKVMLDGKAAKVT